MTQSRQARTVDQTAGSAFVVEAQRGIGAGAVLIAVAAAVALHTAQEQWLAGGPVLAVPVLYGLAVTGAALVAFLLWLRARVIDSEPLRWIAWGVALAGAAALFQGLSVAEIAHHDPLDLSETSAADKYLLWRAVLAAFALGAVLVPGRRRLRRLLIGGFGVLLAVSVWEPAWLPTPRLVDAAGAFTHAYRLIFVVILACTVIATAAWVWRTGWRTPRPHAWVTVMLVIACLDMLAAAGAARFFDGLWWSSVGLRAGQFALPAGGLLADMARLVGLLRHHEQSLSERLHHELAAASAPSDHGSSGDEAAVWHALREVLEQRAFHLAYQPVYALDDGRLLAVEALARFDPEPYRPPIAWFADADRVGLTADLELAVLSTALDSLEHLPGDVALALNTSPAVLADARLPALLEQATPGRLVLEITEHALIDDYELIKRTLAPLRSAGVRLAVDDAGGGFASLRHIVRLAPDIIKLDRSLTETLHTDPVCNALAEALVGFANRTATTLIAEGVEKRAELTAWRKLGAHAAQGYLLARPGPLPVPGATPLIKAVRHDGAHHAASTASH